MEFFKIIDIQTNEQQIQEEIDIENLEKFCAGMFVMKGNREEAKIGSVWGEFTLRRDLIKGGLRFSLLECPNAFTWTITTGYPPARDKIVLHVTINRQQKQDHFIEEIHDFIQDWEDGLKNNY